MGGNAGSVITLLSWGRDGGGGSARRGLARPRRITWLRRFESGGALWPLAQGRGLFVSAECKRATEDFDTFLAPGVFVSAECRVQSAKCKVQSAE